MVIGFDFFSFFIVAFTSLFTIMNPFSTASIFVTITTKNTIKERKEIALNATLVSAVVLIIFTLTGMTILKFFGITIDAFKIAGGIMIMSLGLKMVHAKREDFNEDQEKEAVKKEDTSIVPLAIPMLAGPGAITSTVVLTNDAVNFLGQLTIILAIISVCIITYLLLLNAEKLEEKFLTENTKNVIDKIMGIIVLVIGVQFLINGIGSLVGVWF